MVDIPDTEYITIRRGDDGQVDVFVGGKPATYYRGVEIYDINYVKDTFARIIQEQNPNIMEWHVMSSKTPGKFAKVGNPSPEHGIYAWCRVKYKDGKLGGWVFDGAYTTATYCAYDCASRCAYGARENAAFRRAVLVPAFDNGQNGKNAQSDDLGSQKLCVLKVGPYRIELLLKKFVQTQNKM